MPESTEADLIEQYRAAGVPGARGEVVYLGHGPDGRARHFMVSTAVGHRVLRGSCDFVLVRLCPLAWSHADETRTGMRQDLAGMRHRLLEQGWREWPAPEPEAADYADRPGM